VKSIQSKMQSSVINKDYFLFCNLDKVIENEF
jgi:hypothetical protein